MSMGTHLTTGHWPPATCGSERSAILSRLLILLVAFGLPTTAEAQFNYTIENGEVTITGYTGAGRDVAIPSILQGLPVTRIGDYAFAYVGVTNVTISSGVTSIGRWAFAYTDLTSVTIPPNVNFIGDEAFRVCWNLNSITVATDNPSFASADQVLFNKSQTTLIQYPIARTVSLYAIPEGVTNIIGRAFLHCWRLSSVTIPNSATSIGDEAFWGCTTLASVNIPNSVTSVGDGALVNCSSLSSIIVDEANPAFAGNDGVLFNTSRTTLIRYPPARIGSNYAIPDTVVVIGNEAFEGSGSLISMTVPDGVASIGDAAFQNCSSLISVSIGKGVSSIGELAFNYCYGLGSITVDAGNSFYRSADGVLFNKSLTTLFTYPPAKVGADYDVPVTVNIIGKYAFNLCTNLTSVNLPISVTLIGERSFGNCINLTDITIPAGVTSIGDWAFSFCSSLTTVAIAKGVTLIGWAAFSNCSSLARVTIPESVTTIDGYAFGYCGRLRRVYFQGTAPSPEPLAFSGSYVTSFHLPGTAGWSSTFGGRPAVLWNPRILTDDGILGVQAGQFGFTIEGAADIPVAVEACDSLANPNWTTVANLTFNAEGTGQFIDPDAANKPTRSYRFRAE